MLNSFELQLFILIEITSTEFQFHFQTHFHLSSDGNLSVNVTDKAYMVMPLVGGFILTYEDSGWGLGEEVQ